jgi:membrane protein DedA with SNARE-associated domain
MARNQFHKHGMKIVIIARWLPALRTAVCLTAGLSGVSTLHFLLVDATAACITVPTGVFLGYFAANQIDRVITAFVRAEHTALILTLLAMATALACWMFWRRKHRRTEHSTGQLSPDESPVENSAGTRD